jgi:hypothetical protein
MSKQPRMFHWAVYLMLCIAGITVATIASLWELRCVGAIGAAIWGGSYILRVAQLNGTYTPRGPLDE